MLETVSRLLREERGATAIEYALIASLIAVAIVGAVIALGGSVSGLFNTVASDM
jgi:pilus assembly protein Flp/PilA